MLVALVVLYPDAFADANAPRGRTPRSTSSTASSAAATRCFPTQAIAIEARGRIPEDETFPVAVGEPAGGLERALDARRVANVHALLPPASPRRAADAPWILCFACDRSAYPGAELVWEDDEGLSILRRGGVTMRAIIGLVGAERRLRRRSGSRSSGRSARFRGGATCSGSPALGYLLGVAAFGVVWTQLLVVGVPFGGWAIVVSLVGGRRPHASRRAAARPGAAARLRRRPGSRRPLDLLVTAAGIALVGLLLEALFRAARLQSLQAYDAWAFWVPKAKAIYFFGGLDEQVFTTPAGTDVPAARCRSSTPRRSTRWAASTPSRSTSSSGSSSLGAVARDRRAASTGTPRMAPLAVARARARRAPLRRAAADAAGGRPRRRPRSSSAACCSSLWLRDRRRLATRRGRGAPRGRDAHEARGPALRGVRRSRSRSSRRWLEDARSRGRCSPPRHSPSLAAAVPWRLWYRSRLDRRRGADRRRPRRLVRPGGRLAPRSRSTCSSTPALWSVVPLVAIVALAAAAVWGDRRLAAYVGASSASVFVGGAWVDVLVRGHPDHGRRVREPDRALHGSDRPPRRRRDAAPARLGLATAVGASREPRRTARLVAAAIVAVPLLAYPLVVAADGARFPSRDDCVQARVRGGDGRARPRLRAPRHAAPRPTSCCERVRGVGYVDAEVRGDGCGRWKVLYDGIESYEQGASRVAEARGAGLEAWLEVEPPG